MQDFLHVLRFAPYQDLADIGHQLARVHNNDGSHCNVSFGKQTFSSNASALCGCNVGIELIKG